MEKIYEKLVRGDPKAQAEVYNEFRNGYWTFLMGRYGDLPREFLEECLQDGFLKIFSKVGQLQNPKKLREWGISVLDNITKNKIRTEYKCIKNGKRIDKPQFTELSEYVDIAYKQGIEKNIDIQLIPNFLNAVKMGPRARLAVDLILQGYNYKEAAKEMNTDHKVAKELFYQGYRKIIKHKTKPIL